MIREIMDESSWPKNKLPGAANINAPGMPLPAKPC
jgi:hypothetical protein